VLNEAIPHCLSGFLDGTEPPPPPPPLPPLPLPLDIDDKDPPLVPLTPLKERNFIVFSEQQKQVNLDYSTNQKIIAVHPDTLYFDFTTRKFKKVPIKLISELVFVKQFGQSKKIILNLWQLFLEILCKAIITELPKQIILKLLSKNLSKKLLIFHFFRKKLFAWDILQI
jgi:uncharacterized protein (DUF2344 family)